MNNIQSQLILIILIISNSSKLISQSTKDLFSLEGLTIASDSYDDTGYLYQSTSFYIRDTIIENVEYLEYQNKSCYSSYLKIEDKRVYRKNLTFNEEETLIYDFSLQEGDTISLTTLFQPSGFSTYDYYVTSRKIVKLLDNRDRIELILKSDNVSGEIVWIEGIGNMQGKKCVNDINGSIYLNDISEENCQKRSCKDINIGFDFTSLDNSVFLENKSSNYLEIEWDMGDGTIYNEESVSHTYSEKGCREITLTVSNSCGVKVSKSVSFENCTDSLWIHQNNIGFIEISMINSTIGYGILNDSLFRTNDGAYNWEYVPIDFANDSTSYTFRDIKMNENYGVILLQSSAADSDILVTENSGITWSEISIPNINYSAYKNASIDSKGNIIVGSVRRIFSSRDVGKTWSETTLSAGNTSWGNLYQGEDGFVVIANSEQTDIERSIVHLSFDYGENFLLSSTFNQRVYAISFVNEVGYISSDNSILKTIDSGFTWEIVKSFSENKGFRDIHFTSEQVGIVISLKNIYRTSDGGQSWIIENCQNQNLLEGIEISDSLELIRHRSGSIIYNPEEEFDCKTSSITADEINQVLLYPNPFSETLYLKSEPNKINSISIYSIDGILVHTQKIRLKSESISLENLQSGIYIVKMEEENGILSNKTIIKF